MALLTMTAQEIRTTKGLQLLTFSWSQLQPVVALSTTEAEYMSATEAIKEGIWIQGLLKELKLLKKKVTLYSDNQSAIHLCKNPAFYDMTKDVEVKYHFIREKISLGVINIEKILQTWILNL